MSGTSEGGKYGVETEGFNAQDMALQSLFSAVSVRMLLGARYPFRVRLTIVSKQLKGVNKSNILIL